MDVLLFWLKRLIVPVLILLVCWGVLVILAARLPPGLLKDLTSFLPACVTCMRRLRKDPRVPRSAKIAIAIAIVWVLSPIDLIPEFLPIIGPLDDVVVVVLALRFAARRIPREAISDAWIGERRLLDRLLGGLRERARPSLHRAFGDRYSGRTDRWDKPLDRACVALSR
jgi:uncharacterized membrane protein YkvA (DUF1232 family)